MKIFSRVFGRVVRGSLGAVVGVCVAPALAATLDIRVSAPLSSASNQSSYTLTISDCREVTAISVGAGGQLSRYEPGQARRPELDSPLCELPFNVSGAQQHSPSAVVSLVDGSELETQKQFAVEKNPPEVSLGSVAITGQASETSDQQYFQLEVSASDDTAISYVAASVLGLRASDLRAAGGVVDQAAQTAYVNATKTLFPNPASPDQYNFSIPLPNALPADAIAHDALVLVELRVVDASGNQTEISRIVNLGSDLEEVVEGLYVAPTSLTFNNLLQMSQLVPSIDYQFRGLTPSPGAGHGIQYNSANPEQVHVGSDGVVYPLQSTPSPVDITLTLGEFSQVVPVTVDLSKDLVGLSVSGVDTQNPVELPSLNRFHSLPQINGLLKDRATGEITEVPLNTSSKVEIVLPEGAGALIEIRDRSLRAAAAIDAQNPMTLQLRLVSDPTVKVDVPLVAIDAFPQAGIKVFGDGLVGESLKIVGDATDDANVASVELWLNGGLIHRWTQAPYELDFPLSDELLGQKLTFKIVAVDSAGQTTDSNFHSVTARRAQDLAPPQYDFALPLNGARLISGAPFTLAVETRLDEDFSSDINGVEFFMEGQKQG